MKILLIPGHGGTDSGAVAFSRREADLSREITALLQKEFLKYQCDCRVYNFSLSAYHEIITLGKDYDFSTYDYVFEVHFNASTADNGDGSVKGSEIYKPRGSGDSEREQNILRALATLGLKNRGVKEKDFDLIAYIKRQGVACSLLEICFLDDADDMKIYVSNKEEIARLIASSFGLKRRDSVFSDIENHWAKEDIEALAAKGVLKGYSDGTFRPDQPITRAEFAVALNRLSVDK